jgi:hypothetical protein
MHYLLIVSLHPEYLEFDVTAGSEKYNKTCQIFASPVK